MFSIKILYNHNKAFFLIPYFSYIQQAFVFHLLRDFCNVHNHIVAFFPFSFLERKRNSFDIFFKLFFAVFLSFLVFC